MKFSKMHGAGNDLILVDDRDGTIGAAAYSSIAIQACRRKLSLGADGIIFIRPAEEGGDFSMLYYNADGSLGEMCGNGARCAARYGYDHGLAGELQRIETTAGLVVGQRIEKDLYCIRLNDPSRVEAEIGIPWEGRILSCSYIELGRPGIPHAVVDMQDWDELDRRELADLGNILRHWGVFPNGANVTFWKSLEPDHVKAITYERGVEDFTLACGTGAGSTAVSLYMRGLMEGSSLQLDFPGGELQVSLITEGDAISDIYLTGSAVVVADGELYIE